MQHDGVIMRWAGGDGSPGYSPDCAPYASEAEFIKDMLLAAGFLTDTVRVSDGIAIPARVEPGSLSEREARVALARLLRAGRREDCGERVRSLTRMVCSNLADLFDPENELDPFELTLSRRSGKKGPVPSRTFDEMIAWYIDQQATRYSNQTARGQMKAAIDDAMKCFGVSRAKAYSAWQKYRHIADGPCEACRSASLEAGRSKVEPTI